jgi:hypothetical protein
MNRAVAGKLMRLLFVAIYLAGIISVAFCLTGNFSAVSACCRNNKQAAAKNSENCLSHCAKQKTFALKTEPYSQKISEIKVLFSAQDDSILPLKNPISKASIRSNFYPNEAIPKLLPSQIYLTTYFTLAPPVIL